MRSITSLSGLVILSLLVACGPSAPAATPTPEPAPTPVEIVAGSIEDIVGVWATYCGGSTYYVQFLADGTVRIAESVERLEKAPWGTGDVWFEGTVFHETDTICGSQAGTYEVRLVQEGGKTVALRWNVVEDDCGIRPGCYRGVTKRASSE